MDELGKKVVDVENKWVNFFADNGIPIPLIRHRGRGDLVATVAVFFMMIVGAIMLLGGSSYGVQGKGLYLAIPRLESFGGSLTAIVTVIGSLIGYVTKRAQDLGMKK